MAGTQVTGGLRIRLGWWALVVAGVAGVPAGSIPLLPLWVGLIALSKGVTDLVQGFELRSWRAGVLTSPVSDGATGADSAQRGSS